MGLFTISVKVEESLTNRKIFVVQKINKENCPKRKHAVLGTRARVPSQYRHLPFSAIKHALFALLHSPVSR